MTNYEECPDCYVCGCPPINAVKLRGLIANELDLFDDLPFNDSNTDELIKSIADLINLEFEKARTE